MLRACVSTDPWGGTRPPLILCHAWHTQLEFNGVQERVHCQIVLASIGPPHHVQRVFLLKTLERHWLPGIDAILARWLDQLAQQ
jgi:hypothetical protein